MTASRLFLLLGACTFLFASGCGEAGSKVSGTLSNGGESLQVSDQGDLQIHFIQEQGGTLTGQTFMTSVDSSGHFEAEVPAGEYRIAVQQLDPYPNVDKLKGKFSQNKTPIKQSIQPGDKLEIDLSSYEK
ncbi:hypothetical protein [Bremerella cremea]|uniref:hypothetical protein n=1 Tax=Bremerella cremea TaxID=1031537 RepID=UPI0031F0563E